ncbi:MAG: 50S ribosomal protein L1 [Candidatus Brocadiia bacterium]
MKKLSKRLKKIAEMVKTKTTPENQGKGFELAEAIGILKSQVPTKFDQSVQLAVRLGIDTKKGDQLVRGSISLPHGIGKSRKVIVFAAGEEAKQARDAGADEVGVEELVKKIEGGWSDFDIAIAHPSMMRVVGKLGKVLGPQGKMPSPKTGTVTEEISFAVKEFKAGKIEYRNDAYGNVHCVVGKLSFKPEAIQQNITAFLEHLKSLKPSSAKGEFIRNLTLTSTMGPGLKLFVRAEASGKAAKGA